jgi:hypothetical protein
MCVLILTKSGLGYIMGGFSQTHPVTLLAKMTEGNLLFRCWPKKNKLGKEVSKNPVNLSSFFPLKVSSAKFQPV